MNDTQNLTDLTAQENIRHKGMYRADNVNTTSHVLNKAYQATVHYSQHISHCQCM